MARDRTRARQRVTVLAKVGGMTVEGTAVDEGRFERDTNYISDRILDEPDAQWPVEVGRYRLIAARACPWAHRAVIVRRLLGLEDALSLGLAGPTHDWRSWKFDLDPGEVDPVLGIYRLREAFEARYPGYERGITVPTIVDVPRRRLSQPLPLQPPQVGRAAGVVGLRP